MVCPPWALSLPRKGASAPPPQWGHRGPGMAFPDCGLGRVVRGTFGLLESSPVILGFTPAFVSPVKHAPDTWAEGE